MTEYRTTRRNRLAAGLCIRCGGPKEGDAQECEDCRKKACQRVKDLRLKRKSLNLCTVCGSVNDTTFASCSVCIVKVREKLKERGMKYVEAGMCFICGDVPREPGKQLCAECLSKQREATRKLRDSRRVSNLCIQCGKDSPLIGSPVCDICYFKRAALRYFDESERWPELQQLWETQNHKCPYTGRVLALGTDTELDHTLPVSKFPELKSDISNVKWTHRAVNQMKKNMLPDEFTNIAVSIAEHTKETASAQDN